MSLEYSPIRNNQGARDTSGADPPSDPGYWNVLINEKLAAEFLGLTVRSMQAARQRGGGSRFIRLSARCIRYRRIDLREWAEAHIRTSTSDTGRAV